MKRLETKMYTKTEISELTGIKKDKNFSRNVQKYLDSSGYKYLMLRTEIKIIDNSYTNTQRVKELAFLYFDIGLGHESYEFMVFLYALMNDEDFISMPWVKRENFLKDKYFVEISERQLRTWFTKLENKGLFFKDKVDRKYWKTSMKDGIKKQEVLVDGKESDDWKTYWQTFFKLRDDGVENVGGATLSKLGYCCYGCNSLIMNAIAKTEIVEEIIDLIELELQERAASVNRPLLF